LVRECCESRFLKFRPPDPLLRDQSVTPFISQT
jgi:hypothetical protein